MSKQIPTEIRSGLKLYKGIYFRDLCVVFFWWMFFDSYSPFVAPSLTMFYTIFNILMGMFLTFPSLTNPGRRNYETLLIILIKDRKVYHHEAGNPGKEIRI
jgi:hypothetical protein